MLLIEKHSSHLTGVKDILELNMNDCDPRTQIKVASKTIFQYGNSFLKFLDIKEQLSMVAHTFQPNSQEAESGESL